MCLSKHVLGDNYGLDRDSGFIHVKPRPTMTRDDLAKDSATEQIAVDAGVGDVEQLENQRKVC